MTTTTTRLSSPPSVGRTGASASTAPRRPSRAPLDPRLVREVRAARRHVVRTAALGVLQAVCVITTALVIGHLGAELLVERALPQSAPSLLGLLVVSLAVRALAVLVEQRTAHRAATAAIAQLRGRVVAHAAQLGPRGSAGRGADLTALATTGIENLRPYLVGYVPQLLLSLTVTPLCLLTIGLLDLTSALIAAFTLPLIPLFMILVGKLTVGRSERLLADMRAMWAQMLDLVDGLPTLRALGREKGPEKVVQRLGDRHRASTMGSLKYAFLSGMVLELLATLCVALIAVSIGMRLVYGHMELAPALAVLVLAPEVYQPLRNVGSQYHSSTDGLAAVTAAFEVLDEPAIPDGHQDAPDLHTTALALRGVSVRSRDGMAPHRAEVTVHPGRVLALTGPSGSGKTTAMQVMLGLLEPDQGRAEVVAADGTVTDVRELRRRSLWDQVALLPQRPILPPGTIASVLRSVRPDASQEELDQAAAATGLDAVVAERGWDADLGRAGSGISLGERQRLALARALLSPAPLVVLDEPTAHLDGATEQIVLELIASIRQQGRTVVVVAHRSRLVDIADDVAQVHPGPAFSAPVGADDQEARP